MKYNKINIIITNRKNELLKEIKFDLSRNDKKYLSSFNNLYLNKISYIMGIYNEINATLQ